MELGEQYGFKKEILPELVTGNRDSLIQPRVEKAREYQTNRSRDKAEVFTPSWICNVTSAVISLGNGISDDHQRCLGDLVLFRRLGKCSNGADERLLLRPGCFVNDRCRSICRIAV